ncbi:MAG: SDR family NAD(P)-dependent oxidoreductase [Bacillota bacterium]
MKSLAGKVAVVTGASRGGGRGIAQVLGEFGATVYVTGRTSRTSSQPSRRETIEDAADDVSARGGMGIPVRCDHTDDQQVQALFDRIRREQGRLDLLVNNVWGGEEGYQSGSFENGVKFSSPFWEQSLERWEKQVTAGVRAHLIASMLAAPIMISQGAGLIINTTFQDRGLYLGNVIFDLALNATTRLAHGISHDLKPFRVAAIALSPGYMRTERVMESIREEDLSQTESVEYIGRAVAALLADPNVIAKTGQLLMVGDLALEYGFTDVDGRTIAPLKTR